MQPVSAVGACPQVNPGPGLQCHADVTVLPPAPVKKVLNHLKLGPAQEPPLKSIDHNKHQLL